MLFKASLLQVQMNQTSEQNSTVSHAHPKFKSCRLEGLPAGTKLSSVAIPNWACDL